MALGNAIEKALEKFNPDNPFHVALKAHGEYNYTRIIERATEYQHEAIANSHPIVDIAEAVKQKALEMFADERYMRGLKLEEDLGL
ncbi:hypothetical protein IFT69_10210 [Pseudomonas putida]|nr:hypothetical protein [Pseudomonas putida]